MDDRYTRRLRLARSALEEAGGRPLSYAELAALGVEHPAQTIYELEVAGERIVRGRTGVSLAPEASSQRAKTRRRSGSAEGRWPPKK